MKLLIVEDDPEISEMLKDFLITENFEADTAHDGAEACSMFESVSYDLVLLDLMIPKISGMEAVSYTQLHWSDHRGDRYLPSGACNFCGCLHKGGE